MFKKRLTMQISTNLRRIALFFLSMVLSSGIIFAQERTITGTVTAEGEGPLPGVNVTVQGTVIGAISDLNGGYTIKVPGPTAVLLFSSIGYTTKQVTVGTQTVIDMELISDVRALQEVVVTGYTVQRRKDLTGSIAVVEPAKLTAVPTGNVTNALQGRAAGVSVIDDGRPGETGKVRIRGFGSFENNEPLFVVDGAPTQDISSLNPNDVESISILKDAGAASIYGSRASNGVIIVTTKKGSKGTKVSYSMYYGTQDPGKGPTNLLDAQGYADLQWLVYKNDKLDGTIDADGNGILDFEVHPIYGSSANASPTMPFWAANTDWYKEMTRPAMIQNHDVSLSGGTDNAKFFASIGIFERDGIVIYTDAKKYTGRFNSEFSFLKDRVKVGENIAFAYRKNHGVSNNDEGAPVAASSYRTQPIIPVIWNSGPFDGLSHDFIDGDWGSTGISPRLGNASNVVATMTRNKDNDNWNIHLVGSAFVDVKILQGLSFKSTLGGTFDNGYYMNYSYKTYENSENNQTQTFTEGAYYSNEWVWTNQLTLDKTIGQHKILAFAGYESLKLGVGRGVEGQRATYFTDDVLYRTLNNGATLLTAYNPYVNTPTTMVSQFFRADYSLMDKYMLSATVRRDGSSKFGPDTRYGIFPSFSAGWRISDEQFFQSVSFISDMKIRGSWGQMGSQVALSPANQFYSYGGDPGSSFYDLNGQFTGSLQGFRPTRIGNPGAKWETSENMDIGFDAGLLQNKITVKFDWYQRKNKDLLYPVELPGVAGGATVPYVNIAEMTNKGVDLELAYKETFGDVGFEGSIMFTTVNNNIDAISEGNKFFDSGSTRYGAYSRNMVGHSLGEFFGYQVISLFQENEFHIENVIDEDTGLPVLKPNGEIVTVLAQNEGVPVQDGAEPGFFKYLDTNNDGEITPEDRVFMGSPVPKFEYSINLGLTYKNFDLTAFILGKEGNKLYNNNTWWLDFWPSFQGQKSTGLLNNSWTPTNTEASVPKASNKSNFSNNTVANSYYVEDASFARLKNLQLGYTLPQSVTSKINIGSIRVYVQGVNLLTLTSYKGLDPEISGDDRSQGKDEGNYPLVRQYIFGLNVNF